MRVTQTIGVDKFESRNCFALIIIKAALWGLVFETLTITCWLLLSFDPGYVPQSGRGLLFRLRSIEVCEGSTLHFEMNVIHFLLRYM